MYTFSRFSAYTRMYARTQILVGCDSSAHLIITPGHPGPLTQKKLRQIRPLAFQNYLSITNQKEKQCLLPLLSEERTKSNFPFILWIHILSNKSTTTINQFYSAPCPKIITRQEEVTAWNNYKAGGGNCLWSWGKRKRLNQKQGKEVGGGGGQKHTKFIHVHNFHHPINWSAKYENKVKHEHKNA